MTKRTHFWLDPGQDKDGGQRTRVQGRRSRTKDVAGVEALDDTADLAEEAAVLEMLLRGDLRYSGPVLPVLVVVVVSSSRSTSSTGEPKSSIVSSDSKAERCIFRRGRGKTGWVERENRCP